MLIPQYTPGMSRHSAESPCSATQGRNRPPPNVLKASTLDFPRLVSRKGMSLGLLSAKSEAECHTAWSTASRHAPSTLVSVQYMTGHSHSAKSHSILEEPHAAGGAHSYLESLEQIWTIAAEGDRNNAARITCIFK